MNKNVTWSGLLILAIILVLSHYAWLALGSKSGSLPIVETANNGGINRDPAQPTQTQ